MKRIQHFYKLFAKQYFRFQISFTNLQTFFISFDFVFEAYGILPNFTAVEHARIKYYFRFVQHDIIFFRFCYHCHKHLTVYQFSNIWILNYFRTRKAVLYYRLFWRKKRWKFKYVENFFPQRMSYTFFFDDKMFIFNSEGHSVSFFCFFVALMEIRSLWNTTILYFRAIRPELFVFMLFGLLTYLGEDLLAMKLVRKNLSLYNIRRWLSSDEITHPISTHRTLM